MTKADLQHALKELEVLAFSNFNILLNNSQGTAATLLFHAELESDHSHTETSATPSDPTRYSTFLSSRPETLEVDAISLIRSLHTSFPSVSKHIVHLSAATALPLLSTTQEPGLTAETCFHYLSLSESVLDAQVSTGRPHFKCCPPIRDTANADALWAALKGGTLNCVVSDHSPCVPQLKRLAGATDGGAADGDYMQAWGGISSLGLGFSIMWSLAKRRGVSLAQIVRWMGVETAKLARLESTKGALKEGLDADLVFWDLDEEWTVGLIAC